MSMRRKADIVEQLARCKAAHDYHRAVAEQLHKVCAVTKFTAFFVSCRIDRALSAHDSFCQEFSDECFVKFQITMI
jgi:hypothetical protein